MSSPPPSITLRCLPLFLAALDRRGIEPGSVLAPFGLSPSLADGDEIRVPLDLLAPLGEACARAAKDPAFGLTVALEQDRGTWGLIEFASRTAPDLLTALSLAVEHASLLNDRVELAVTRLDGEVEFVHRMVGTASGGAGRHFDDYTLGTFALLARELGGGIQPTRLCFVQSAPAAGVVHWSRLFGHTTLRFEAAQNAICWREEDVRRPLDASDPALHALLVEQSAREAQARPTVGPTDVPRIRAALVQAFDRGLPELNDVAARLHLSPRTLQRRLTEAGTRWHALVEDVRRERALAWVLESERPLAEVADALGYAESRSFIRAFRRWTGQTPGEARSARSAPSTRVASGVHASGAR